MDTKENMESGETVQVEQIMAAIRRQLASREQAEPAVDSAPGGLPDGPLPAAFYDHLNQARLAHDRIEPQVIVTPPNGLAGQLLQPLRLKLHELIIFYVNQLAANQIRVNAHLLQALTILSQEVEKGEGDQE